MLGLRSKYDNSRLVNVLKIQPRPLKSTLIDMADRAWNRREKILNKFNFK